MPHAAAMTVTCHAANRQEASAASFCFQLVLVWKSQRIGRRGIHGLRVVEGVSAWINVIHRVVPVPHVALLGCGIVEHASQSVGRGPNGSHTVVRSYTLNGIEAVRETVSARHPKGTALPNKGARRSQRKGCSGPDCRRRHIASRALIRSTRTCPNGCPTVIHPYIARSGIVVAAHNRSAGPAIVKCQSFVTAVKRQDIALNADLNVVERRKSTNEVRTKE